MLARIQVHQNLISNKMEKIIDIKELADKSDVNVSAIHKDVHGTGRGKNHLTEGAVHNNLLLILLEGVIVQGSINTQQSCEACGTKFIPQEGDKSYIDSKGIYCSNGCKTRPTRYYINGRAFGLRYLYSDPKSGKTLETYRDALEVLLALNRAWKEAGENKKRFKVIDWTPAQVQQLRVENCAAAWIKEYNEEHNKGAKSITRISAKQKDLRCIHSPPF